MGQALRHPLSLDGGCGALDGEEVAFPDHEVNSPQRDYLLVESLAHAAQFVKHRLILLGWSFRPVSVDTPKGHSRAKPGRSPASKQACISAPVRPARCPMARRCER